MPAPATYDSDREFVFRGTVGQLKAGTMGAAEPTDDTAIVHVDEVLHSPPEFAGFAGQEITVKLRDPSGVKEKDEAVFTTYGLVFGQSLMVQEVEHAPVGRGRRLVADRVAGERADRRTAAVADRVARAQLVVRGRISDVRKPETAALAPTVPGAPISEHDPAWMEAVVSVDETVKGEPPEGGTIVVFPSSMDIAWAHVPKFHPGQEGVFMLHREDHPPGLTPTGAFVHTAPHALDVQPVDGLDQVRALVGPTTPRRASKPRKARP